MINEDDSNNIRLLNKNDVRDFESQLIMNIDNYQHPFQTLVGIFTEYKVDKKTGTEIEFIDWQGMYDYLKQNHKYMRITQVIPAESTEGLARRFLDYVKVQDTSLYKYDGVDVEWDLLPNKLKKKYLEQHNKQVHFETFEDLIAQTDIVFKLGKSNKLYQGFESDLDVSNFITPTLKQIEIRSWKDLKNIWEYITDPKNARLPIGFTYLNEIMSATEDAYKPFKVGGFGEKFIKTYYVLTKYLMRFSQGFLLRNAVDTLVQTATDMYIEQGLNPLLFDLKQMHKYIRYGENIYDVYRLISEERLCTLLHIMISYKNLSKESQIDKKIAQSKELYDYLNRYIEQAKLIENPSARIEYRLKVAEQIKKEYDEVTNKVLVSSPAVIDKMYYFLMNIRFAEYYKMYDNKNENVYGLRLDAKSTKMRDNTKVLRKKIAKQDTLFEDLLINISAFMQTEAMPDMFKQKQYKELYDISNKTKAYLLEDTHDEQIEKVEKEIEAYRNEASTFINIMSTLSGYKVYNYITERTENLARILGFILNQELYGKTFDDSVQRSLKSWFNYGQRTTLEMQLMYDIPYISFPIRSLRNWASRILDPNYAVMIDDIIDGIYGQYADEDGQYSEFEQFMLQNGWIPVTDKWGIRAGSSVFDTISLLNNTDEQLKQRRSPIIRALTKLMETHDVSQAANQLATVGVLNRFAQQATLGAYDKKSKTFTGPTIGRMSSVFFEYNQYTPKKYGYLYQNNGRAKYYENIYRDWFNKYGRMRKPTVDPVQLVKGIQWKQFVRRMQHKYRR